MARQSYDYACISDGLLYIRLYGTFIEQKCALNLLTEIDLDSKTSTETYDVNNDESGPWTATWIFQEYPDILPLLLKISEYEKFRIHYLTFTFVSNFTNALCLAQEYVEQNQIED